jgi:xylose dehydrogenase (NAD/NADP)
LLPQLERARSRIDAGAIGALRRVEINVAHKRDARHGWRSDPELAGSGALHELGPDALDTAELLLGPVRQIRMTAADRLQEGSVEDAALLETTHDWDRRALLHVSWNEAPDRPLARCTGDLGEIEVGPERSALRRGRDHEELLGGPVDRRMATQAVLGRFLMQRLDPDPISDPAAATIEWLHAAARSLHEGRWQTT